VAGIDTMINLAVYAVPAVVLLAVFSLRRWRRDFRNHSRLNQSRAAGLSEPASLHPLIDPNLCHGCGACVSACPEGNVLGVISGCAHLVAPDHCIGHGACKSACPYDAITLVFGSARRGVDIPVLGPDFQTAVPGIYIAGELGGMGLIRNAVTQGAQAMDFIRKSLPKHQLPLDVVIVGAGPAGFAASLAAREQGLRFRTLEQESFGGTVAHFPRGKLVMTAPVVLPGFGKVRLRETSKEALIELWHQIRDKTGLRFNLHERVDDIRAIPGGFEVVTDKGSHQTCRVLLAIGRRGTPRKLGVPGEELPKVVYRLIDPAQYQGQHVLVVGGGDAALEAACSIAEEPGATVTLSYRSDAFSRAKQLNRERVDSLAGEGRLCVLLSSNVKAIHPDRVELAQGEKPVELPNDAVIVCAGGVLPTAFLQRIGVEVETRYGTA
jgi:thioredoxin reductase (NADPH)